MAKDILFLGNDCFYAAGGIAHYNRNFCYIASRVLNGSRLIFVSRSTKKSQIDKDTGAVIKAINPKNIYLYFFRSFLLAFRIKKKFVVICGHINLLPLAALLKFFFNCNVILQIHGVEAWAASSRLNTYIIRKYINGVLSVSNTTTSRFVGWSAYYGPLSLVSNCINVSEYRKQNVLDKKMNRKIKSFARGRKIIMFLGRLDDRERYKGVDEMISVFINYPNLSKTACYLVCGGGSDLARLRNKVNRSGLSDTIKFTGLVNESNKRGFLKMCDVFVLAGFGEGFGITILEAIASGAPVIASTEDGSHETLVGAAFGVGVNPSNVDSLYNALIECFLAGRSFNDKIMYFDIQNALERFSPHFHEICS